MKDHESELVARRSTRRRVAPVAVWVSLVVTITLCASEERHAASVREKLENIKLRAGLLQVSTEAEELNNLLRELEEISSSDVPAMFHRDFTRMWLYEKLEQSGKWLDAFLCCIGSSDSVNWEIPLVAAVRRVTSEHRRRRDNPFLRDLGRAGLGICRADSPVLLADLLDVYWQAEPNAKARSEFLNQCIARILKDRDSQKPVGDSIALLYDKLIEAQFLAASYAATLDSTRHFVELIGDSRPSRLSRIVFHAVCSINRSLGTPACSQYCDGLSIDELHRWVDLCGDLGPVHVRKRLGEEWEALQRKLRPPSEPTPVSNADLKNDCRLWRQVAIAPTVKTLQQFIETLRSQTSIRIEADGSSEALEKRPFAAMSTKPVSAWIVMTQLARRHGEWIREGDTYTFRTDGAGNEKRSARKNWRPYVVTGNIAVIVGLLAYFQVRKRRRAKGEVAPS